MNIEVLVRWTELKAVPKDENDISHLIDPEHQGNSGMVQAQVHYDYSPMVLDTKDIARFNRSNDKNYTTLRMYDGEGYVIKFPYTEFMNLYIETTGNTILSCLPEGWEKSANSTPIEGGLDIGYEEYDDDDEESDEDDLII